jgi:hypothetical protein
MKVLGTITKNTDRALLFTATAPHTKATSKTTKWMVRALITGPKATIIKASSKME